MRGVSSACVCVGGTFEQSDAMATHWRRYTCRMGIKKTPAPASRATYQALCKSISLHWLLADWPRARAHVLGTGNRVWQRG